MGAPVARCNQMTDKIELPKASLLISARTYLVFSNLCFQVARAKVNAKANTKANFIYLIYLLPKEQSTVTPYQCIIAKSLISPIIVEPFFNYMEKQVIFLLSKLINEFFGNLSPPKSNQQKKIQTLTRNLLNQKQTQEQNGNKKRKQNGLSCSQKRIFHQNDQFVVK